MENTLLFIYFFAVLIYISYWAYNGVFHTKKTFEKWDSLSGKPLFKDLLSKESQEFWFKVGSIGAMILVILILIVLILYFLGILESKQ